ncbi:MORN repeat-containing protein [Niveibacterium terrae]|uniref:MORN repeat-containing protein n=1 Tax=Niveibacterium terrae TaxID=3373598 RepID=UPI003A91C9B9
MRAGVSILLIAVLAIAHSLVRADESCKVIDPELQQHYEGPCVDGLAEGEGKASGRASYEGGFHLGMKHGLGEKRWANGDRYTGEFRSDKRHGRGIYRWAHGPWAGEQYAGDYVENRRQGFGIYTWPTGDRYEGPWDMDAMTGPPTPMMIQRNRARAAALKALGKPGLAICKLEAVGIGNVVKVEAKVLALKGDVLDILRDGAARTEDPFGWYPCP